MYESHRYADIYGQEIGSNFNWGGGGFACFFSRFKGNLFLEASLGGGGGLGGWYAGGTGYIRESVTTIPFLLGFRYDILPRSIESFVQPYVTAGGGSYWMIYSRTSESPQTTGYYHDSGHGFGFYEGRSTKSVDWLCVRWPISHIAR